MPSVPPADPRTHSGYWIPLLAGAALFALTQTFSKPSPILLAFLLTLLALNPVIDLLRTWTADRLLRRDLYPHEAAPCFWRPLFPGPGATIRTGPHYCTTHWPVRLCVSAFGVLGVFGSAPLIAIADILHDALYRDRYLPTVTSASLERLSRLALPEKFSEGK